MAELFVADHHRALADTQPLTDRTFRDMFRRCQMTSSPVEIEALRPVQANRRGWFALAFAWAEQENLLRILVDLCINKVLSKPFFEAAKTAGLTFDNNLQSILHTASGMADAELFRRKFPISADQICRVLIDRKPVGTGFLVKPRIVATAWHVIRSLVEWEPAENRFVPTDTSKDRLTFEFGLPVVQVQGGSASSQSMTMPPTAQWLTAASPCHRLEIDGRLPDDHAELVDHYDYALIQLSSIVRMDLPGLPLESHARLGAREEPILIMQHPYGAPLRHDCKLAEPANPPAYRVAHNVNTDKGSSGAPCLNEYFNVAGLHQSGPANGPSPEALFQNQNRCIPIDHIRPAVEAIDPQDAGVMPLTRLSSGEPVVGRSQLARWAYDTAARDPETPPLLVISADSALPGRTFTVALLRDMLPSDDHKVVHLPSADFEGETLDKALIRLFAALDKTVPEVADGFSAHASKLRRQVMTKVLPALATLNDPMTWMVLDDFDRDLLDGRSGSTRDLFDALFQTVTPASNLRFAITQRGDNPAVPKTLTNAEIELLRPPHGEELDLLSLRMGLTQQENPAVDFPLSPKAIRDLMTIVVSHFEQDRFYYRKLTRFMNGEGL